MTGGEEAEGQISFRGELLRKATHLFALVIPGGYYLLRLDRWEMLAIMIPITVAMILLDISRLQRGILWKRLAHRLFTPLIRGREKRGDFTGATYILLSACLTIALFAKPIAVAALAFIVVGDILAAVVGRTFGRHPIGNKTLEGSAACLLGTLLVAIVLPGLDLEVRLIGAVTAAVVEGLPVRVDDNVSVPILSGLVMTLSLKILTNF